MIDLNVATLWDLLIGKPRARPKPEPRRVRRVKRVVRRPRVVASTASDEIEVRRDLPARMSDRYALMQETMLAEHGIRVRKWRSSMSGVAWQVTYRDGSVRKLLESPRPRGPVSASIFLHEVGHHAIGFNRYKPRCLEEYHAWMYSIEQMRAWGLNISRPVLNRVHDSLHYAIAKAARRGLKRLPSELEPYAEPRVRESGRGA